MRFPTTRWVLSVVVTGAACTLWAVAAPPAAADVSGPCDATIAGVDVRGRSATDPADAIPVGTDDVVMVTLSSPGGIESHDLVFEYAFLRWTVSSQTNDGEQTATDQIEVSDYARFGAGLYTLTGQARLSDGSTCRGSVLVDVQTNPLTTVAGILAGGLTVAGTAGVVGATALEARRARTVQP